MEGITYTIKIEDQEISFKDDEMATDSQPSPFNIMMDLIPVYFTYKYRERKELFAPLEKISCRLNYLSDYYTCLTRIHHFANSKKKRIFSKTIKNS